MRGSSVILWLIFHHVYSTLCPIVDSMCVCFLLLLLYCIIDWQFSIDNCKQIRMTQFQDGNRVGSHSQATLQKLGENNLLTFILKVIILVKEINGNNKKRCMLASIIHSWKLQRYGPWLNTCTIVQSTSLATSVVSCIIFPNIAPEFRSIHQPS